MCYLLQPRYGIDRLLPGASANIAIITEVEAYLWALRLAKQLA